MNQFEDVLDDGANFIVKLQDKKREVEDGIIQNRMARQKIDGVCEELRKQAVIQK